VAFRHFALIRRNSLSRMAAIDPPPVANDGYRGSYPNSAVTSIWPTISDSVGLPPPWCCSRRPV
jgi:hypothetical protein